MGVMHRFTGGKAQKGSSQKIPTQTPDNLRSKDSVEIILGLGEGPWQGLVDGAKSFFIGDTALLSPAGASNFEQFDLKFFPGASPLEVIVPSLGGFASSTTISTNLSQGVTVTRSGTIWNIDAIDIRINFTQLFHQAKDGATSDETCNLKIEYKATSSGTWIVPYGTMPITGKTTSTYVKEFRIPVARIAGTYDVRVTKIDPVDSSTTQFCVVGWESMQEVITTNLNFPSVACAQLNAKATDQFSSLPDFYGIYNTRLVRVPTNYNPTTRVYTGIWDGTFQVLWTNNPAWVLYDFVMNDTFGLNAYFPMIMDKWDCYEAAQWCDVMVSDGKGGLQPRYTFNGVIAEARSGREMARYIAGMFNGIFYDDGNGTAHVKVDKSDAAVALFTPENVQGGDFNYAFTDIMTRFNEITVSFVNPLLSWKEDRRIVKDDAHIARYGRIPSDFIAVACTNVQESLRRARYKLKTGTTECCSVTFRTNRLGAMISPFEVFLISDLDLGYSTSGKITTIDSTTQFTMRDAIFMEAGITYVLNFQVPDTSYPNIGSHPYKIVQVPVDEAATGTGYIKVVHTSSALPTNLAPNATFSLEQAVSGLVASYGLPKPFRAMRVAEVEGDPDTIEITGIEINRNKNPYIDTATDLGVPIYSSIGSTNAVPGPANVVFEEGFDRFSTSYTLKVTPILNRDAYKLYTDEFEVWSRPASGGTFVRRLVDADGMTVNHPAGAYEFRVLPVNFYGAKATINQVEPFFYTLTNPSDPPHDLDSVNYSLSTNEMSWVYTAPPLDFAGFEVRYRTDTLTDWPTATVVGSALIAASPYSLSNVPAAATMVMVKAVDWFGNYSAGYKFIVRNQGDPDVANIIQTRDMQGAGFTGTKTNCAVSTGVLQANSNGATMWTIGTAPMYPLPTSQNLYGGSFLTMVYQETLVVSGAGALTYLVTYTGNNFRFEYRLTSGITDPWVPVNNFQQIAAGTYDFRATIDGSAIRGTISRLVVNVDVPDIVEEFNDVVIAIGGTRLPKTKTYTVIKNVTAVLIDTGGTALTVRVMDKNPATGPLMQCFNASNAAVAGKIDARIKGYL